MSDNIEREIEEILSQLDEFVPEEGVARRVRRRSSDWAANLNRAITSRLARVSLGRIMLVALGLVLVALLFGRVNPLLARWVIIAGLVLFFTSWILSLRFSQGRSAQRLWRGQVVDLSQPSLSERVRSWLRGKRRRDPRR
ncbi:MAG: hypothetical protein WBF37_12055 [Dehalococcoidia bacterium]